MIKKIIKSIFCAFYDAGLVPKGLVAENYRNRLDTRKLFRGRTVKYDDRGFWYVSPMPGPEELNRYYEGLYWQARGKNEGITARDIDHFLLLRKLMPGFFEKPKKCLNFGAGHGGISHLLYLDGHEVINVEPSGISVDYDDPRWRTVTDISEVNEKVDLVYGSHSLEHVRDIDAFERIIWNMVKDGGYVFWEVPNGEFPRNGGSNGKIFPPHTYYFTVDYFRGLPYQLLLDDTYNSRVFPGPVVKGGEVIRFLGQKPAEAA